MFSYDTALGQIANGANYNVVVFELNANNHSQRRALANALAINAIERDGRLADHPRLQIVYSLTARTTTAGIRGCCS